MLAIRLCDRWHKQSAKPGNGKGNNSDMRFGYDEVRLRHISINDVNRQHFDLANKRVVTSDHDGHLSLVVE
jgi:hypothetical protein